MSASHPPVLSADETLNWLDRTSSNWHQFVAAHPAVLALPCDIYKASHTVADLLQHIVAVELRYAQRLAALPESPYEDVPNHSPDAIYSTHDQAMALLRQLLDDPTYDWSAELTFETVSLGPLAAPRCTLLFHLLLHSIRHYAQLATLTRHNGYKTNFPMDFLMMSARRL